MTAKRIRSVLNFKQEKRPDIQNLKKTSRENQAVIREGGMGFCSTKRRI